VDAIAKELGLLNHKDKRLCELSRGWRRKASLLIALASNKKLIIMDEPFSGIDSGSRALISELLEKKPSNMIIISHIQSRIRFDHLIVVESGRITYNGPYKPIEWYS
ncbi:MAG: ATP-binding cassette domain-containing protein, partial [Desulfurococcus sp.]